MLVVVVALALCASLAACGSRRSHDELLADARALADGSRPGATAATPSGATGTVDPVAGSSTPAGEAATAGAATDIPGSAAEASGGATAPEAAAGAAPVCTGGEAPIRIGTVGEQSGVIGSLLVNGPRAVQAWAAKVNSEGGIRCHKVEYTITDDGGDPSRNQALTQRLVEQTGVIAMVHVNAPIAGQASVSYLTQKGIPVIGNESGSPWFYESPVYRTQQPTGDMAGRAAFATAGLLGVPQGLTKVGVVSCVEAPMCSTVYNMAPEAAPQYGLELAFRYQGSLVQPNYTSACQQAESSGAQMLITIFDANSVSRLRRSCDSVGYDPILVTGGPLAGEGLLNDPELDGSWFAGTLMPYTFTSNPTVAEFQEAMAQFAPGVSPDASAFAGWMSAKMFEAAALAAGDDLTPAGILEGLAQLNGHDFAGATMPLSFKLGENGPKTLCFYAAIIRNRQLESLDDGARHCA